MGFMHGADRLLGGSFLSMDWTGLEANFGREKLWKGEGPKSPFEEEDSLVI